MDNPEETYLHTKTHNIFNTGKFFSDVSHLSIAYIFVFILTFVYTTVIPKLLTVEDYGYWRLFILYIAFSGLLHAGLVDGMYLLWAGKTRDALGHEIQRAFRMLLIFMSVVIGLLCLLLVFIPIGKKEIIYLFLLCCGILNMNTFFQIILQATKNFKIVSKQYFLTSVFFTLSILLLFLLGWMDYIGVMISYIGAQLGIMGIYFIVFRRELFSKKRAVEPWRRSLMKYIKIGWPLLFGNFLAVAITNVDMISISVFFNVRNFALYAFAVAVLNIVGLVTKTVATVFFPHMAGTSLNTKTAMYHTVAIAIIVVWGLLIGFYPFGEAFIHFFLSKYTNSLEYINILLMAIVFTTTIQVLHINYFQLYFKQKKYFLVTLVFACIVYPLCIVVAKTTENLIFIALFKLGVFIAWFIANELLLQQQTQQKFTNIMKRMIAISILILLFTVAFQFHNNLTRMLLYFGGTLPVLSIAFYREVRSLFKGRLIP